MRPEFRALLLSLSLLLSSPWWDARPPESSVYLELCEIPDIAVRMSKTLGVSVRPLELHGCNPPVRWNPHSHDPICDRDVAVQDLRIWITNAHVHPVINEPPAQLDSLLISVDEHLRTVRRTMRHRPRSPDGLQEATHLLAPNVELEKDVVAVSEMCLLERPQLGVELRSLFERVRR